MPALQPAADKAMTLDINFATLHAAAPTTTASAAPLPPAADPDFAEPANPWKEPAPAPAQSRTAVEPSVPPEISQYFPPQPTAGSPPQASSGPDAAPAPVSGGSAPGAPAGASMPGPAAPPTGSSMPAPAPPAGGLAPGAPMGTGASPQRQCFTNAEGVKICYMYDQQNHNTTDVHREGGVNDYHNQSDGSEKEGVKGHIPGNDITGTLNNLGQNLPPNEHKDGNTVFQGNSDVQVAHQQDIHKDNATYTDHQVNSGNGDFDWKSAYKGPDGSKEMAEIDRDGQFEDEEDTRVDAEGKITVGVEEWKGNDDHRFMSDKAGTKDDSQLVWDEDWQQKKQKEDFQGKGVYDFHEESSSRHQVQAKVDGDQGWAEFKQDMDDFDNAFFDDDAGWKAKMKDPRYDATATPAAAVGRREASNPWSDSWDYWKLEHDNYQEEKKHPKAKHSDNLVLPPMEVGDEETGFDHIWIRDEADTRSGIWVRDEVEIATGLPDGVADELACYRRAMNEMGIVATVVLSVMVLMLVASGTTICVSRCARRRRERRQRAAYMNELEAVQRADTLRGV